jgi:hypothetical protein
MKINPSPNFTALVTAHGKTKAYLYRFKIIQSPECICTHGNQTADHLIFDCDRLEKEQEKLTAYTAKEDWPVRKCDLANKYLNNSQLSQTPSTLKNCSAQGHRTKNSNYQEK